MEDLPTTVCCMCGDVGFSDKLCLCPFCKTRFQHSYCSNYYGETKKHQLCDWCIHKEKNSSIAGVVSSSSSSSTLRKHSSSSGRENSSASVMKRSEYSAEKTKHRHQKEEEGIVEKGKNSVVESPRPGARRYKLLKDVMC